MLRLELKYNPIFVPTFREKEKQQARTRMRNKREDPGYREKEREKDRIRRRQSRLRDENLRQKERERDRQYKRLQRSIPVTIDAEHMILNEVEIENEAYVGVVDIEEDPALHVVESLKVELD